MTRGRRWRAVVVVDALLVGGFLLFGWIPRAGGVARPVNGAAFNRGSLDAAPPPSCCTITSCGCVMHETFPAGQPLSADWIPWSAPDGGPLHSATELHNGTACYTRSAVTIGPEGGLHLTESAVDASSNFCLDRSDGGLLSAPNTTGSVQWKSFTVTGPVTISIRARLTPRAGQWPIAWLFNSPCQTPNTVLANATWGNVTCAPLQIELDMFEGFVPSTTSLDLGFHQSSPLLDNQQPYIVDGGTAATHEYTMVWALGTTLADGSVTTDTVTSYVDGQQAHYFPPPYVPVGDMYLILSQLVGGQQTVDPSLLPADAVFERVDVSKP